MQQDPHRVQTITMACCVMHNLLITRNPNHAAPMVDGEDPITHEVLPGVWRDQEDLVGLQGVGNAVGRNTSSKKAKVQRRYLRSYYNSPIGKVDWQDDMI